MTKPADKSQSDKFVDAAREIECNENEARWNERLKKVAKGKPKPPSRPAAISAGTEDVTTTSGCRTSTAISDAPAGRPTRKLVACLRARRTARTQPERRRDRSAHVGDAPGEQKQEPAAVPIGSLPPIATAGVLRP